jgi:hypothetical protein
MDVHPEDWLTMEQAMEDDNHVLLQTEVTDTPPEQPPQLLMISSHAAHGTSIAATFSVLLTLRGKKGITLIDSGSTDSSVDYIFAGKPSCSIVATESRKVKVAGGGYLESFAALAPTTYFIQNEEFKGQFKLLQLKGYDIILGCDWIKDRSPITLDLRADSRKLSIQKNGLFAISFRDFTAPPAQPLIASTQLQRMCISDI